MLDSLGTRLQVTEIPSGEEALLEHARRPADLLVADVRLPGMTGLQLMEKMRKHNPVLKVILITGLTDAKTRKEVADAGANAFFTKPIDMAEFLDAVERLLGMAEGTLPPAPVTPAEAAARPVSLSDLLAPLRRNLNAFAILLMDDQGQVHAQAGEFPGTGGQAAILLPLLNLFSAGTKLSFTFGITNPTSLFAIKAPGYDLYMSHVGSKYALLSVLPCAVEGVYAEKIGPVMAKTGAEILSFLESTTARQESPVISAPPLRQTGRLVPQQPPAAPLEAAAKEATGLFSKIRTGMLSRLRTESAPEKAPEPSLPAAVFVEEVADAPAAILPDVEALFQTSSAETFKPEDLDEFWESANIESVQENVRGAAALSFEEAQKLGLAPRQEE